MPLYALLIAINNYHPDSKVPSLTGCVNDAKAIHQFLQTHFLPYELHVKTLLDKEATYENVIAHFGDKHLTNAQKGDIVFIHFSGHGARGFSAPEFKVYYPDGLDENLICYDSRLPGHFDLADKELAVLIERIANKDVDVIVSLDCCHSGSGTRNAALVEIAESRQWEDREDIRPLSTYLNGHFNKELYLPNARHLLLAACEKKQKAYELATNQGLFTTMLLQVLQQQQGNISYAELFAATRSLMRRTSRSQSPQFESFGHFNVHRYFLKSAENATPLYNLSFEDGQWLVEAGALQGLSLSPDSPSSFTILDQGREIGFAQSEQVQLDFCTVTTDAALDPNKIYQAKLISFPEPPVAVAVESPYGLIFQKGFLVDINKLSSKAPGALSEALAAEKPIYFELTEAANQSPFILYVDDKGLCISRREDGVVLGKIPDKDIHAYQAVFQRLEHLCQYEKSRRLGEGTGDKNQDVKLLLKTLDEKGKLMAEYTSDQITIVLPGKDGYSKNQPYRFEVENRAGRSYHFAFLHFTQDYGVFQMYNEEIPAKSAAMLMEKNEKGFTCSFQLKRKPSAREYFKLIVSAQKINSHLLTQKEINTDKLETTRGVAKRTAKGGGNLAQWFALDMVVNLEKMKA